VRNTQSCNSRCYNYVTNAADFVYGIMYFNVIYATHTHTHTHTHTLHACACACASAVLQSKVKLSTDTELYYDEAVAVSGVTRLRTGRPGELFDFWLEYRRFSSSSIQTASAVLKRPVREADNSLPFRA